MQFLRMDPADLATTGFHGESRDSINAGDITTAEGDQVFTVDTRSYLNGQSPDYDDQVPSQECDTTGKYGNDHSGEVQGLRQDSEEGASRHRIREQQFPDQGLQDEQEGEGRIQGVPGVSEVAEGKATNGFGIRDLGIEPDEIQSLIKPVNGRRARRVKRIVHQAKTALGTAEQIWTELMSLVSTEPSQITDIGRQRLEREVMDPTDPHRIKNQKAAHKFAGVLGQNPKQLRTVAEVYNPNRFGDRAKRFQLHPGQAFDLTLGHDLLKADMQAEVVQYLDFMRPGLVVISPPCTLFTPLQNLNKHRKYQIFLKRLRFARKLLRFSAKVAEKVMSYGGQFVLEHPLTSTAWLENELQQLMADDRVILVACDQCMFDLRSTSGNLHKKPTGFITTSPEIATELDQRCDRSHQHEQVIGSNQTGNRAKRAQVYPRPLVDAILRGYRRHVKTEEINMVGWEDLRRDLQQHLYFMDEIYHDVDAEMLKNVNIIGTDAIPAKITVRENDMVLANNQVPAEIYEIEDAETEGRDEVQENGEEEEGPESRRPRLPRERPFSLQQLVRRAHEGLGHPGNDRLARILKSANASPEAIKIAKGLRCSVCDQHAALHPPRRAAPPRQLHVNEIVGIDTVYIPDFERKRRPALNIVDWASRFQMIIPLKRHTAYETRRAYLQWVKIFGPPTKLYVDLGREFLGSFELGAEQESTIVEPSSLEMPTQRRITERAGRNFKEVFSRTMQQYACQDEEEWRQLVDVANMTCNRLMNKSGYSPIQRVLGYSPRIPGGALSGGANDLATMSLRAGDLQVQKAAEMRLAAARAFHEADCSQALKNALHAGPRQRIDYEVGQTVYFWRKGMEGAKKNAPEYWRGPCRVILTSPPNTIWVNYRGYIVKAAPEHLRLASEEEQFTLSKWIDDITETKKELDTIPRQGYIDLTNEPIPLEDEPAGEEDGRQSSTVSGIPKFRLTGKRDQQNIVFQGDERNDEWVIDEEQKKLVRWHYQPRRNLFSPTEAPDGCPVPLHRIYGQRRTEGNLVTTGERFSKVDDWLVRERSEPERVAWTGRTEFEVKPTRESMGEIRIPASSSKRQRLEEPQPEVEEHNIPAEDQAIEPDIVPEGEATVEELPRGEVRQRDDQEPDPSGEGEVGDERESKRMRTEFIELYLNQIEKALMTKSKKEVSFRSLDQRQRGPFINAINKEIRNNLQTGAYEVLSPEESERIRREEPEKIVKSRFVFTEKPIELDDVEQAKADGLLLKNEGENSTKAKARHVMKGFSETDSENLETTAPQCGRDTVLCTLQIICSHLWKPGYLDFTQAFHSGDKLQREIYASQPAECPLPGYQDRQLLRLLKTCYGLLDGPFAWYQHLKRILIETLGYNQSAGDPCLFYLWDKKEKKLQGIISVATDDLLHGGDETHWRKMEWLNKNYKLGKFTSGDGRFVGKEIKCKTDGSFLVHQPLFAQKVEPIPIEKKRKRERYSFCTPAEITQLRGLLGSLAWLAKETRPDIAGRVAILQQSMPTPFVQDMVEANVLAKEAVKHEQLGIVIQPIPLKYLRVGTVSDASWGNVRPENDQETQDFWEEKDKYWIRHHRQPRRLLFHPAGAPQGPNCYELGGERVTIMDGEELRDQWNTKDSNRQGKDEAWCGQTIFFKKNDSKPEVVKDKFLQHGRLSSQGGFITFFYDSRMETEEKSYPISIVNWKSFRIKRCTVNTLSAECQAMLQGIGALHWLRFLIQEIHGQDLRLDNWETRIGEIPCIAVTDSKSLYDTINKCCNTSAHIEDKRTAIDVTILKRDFSQTKGQVRWIEGTRMISDSLTKKMGSNFLRKVMKTGTWSLSEIGFREEQDALLVLVSTEESLAGVNSSPMQSG